jgi:hypothetical protein
MGETTAGIMRAIAPHIEWRQQPPCYACSKYIHYGDGFAVLDVYDQPAYTPSVRAQYLKVGAPTATFSVQASGVDLADAWRRLLSIVGGGDSAMMDALQAPEEEG